MHRPNVFAPSEIEWQAYLHSLDTRLAKAIFEYEQVQGVCTDEEMADGFNNLFQFSMRRGSGRDPDYNTHVLPIAYALHYAVQNTAIALRALAAVYSVANTRRPRQVLDIGSGLDAVALALESSRIRSDIEAIVCLDPSNTMRAFAKHIDCTLLRQHYPGSVESIIRFDDRRPRFDIISFCYAFQYHHERCDDSFFIKLARHTSELLAPGGVVIVCGPRAKAFATRRFATALQARSDIEFHSLEQEYLPYLRTNYWHCVQATTAIKRQRVDACSQWLRPHATERLFWGGQVGGVFSSAGFEDTVLFAAVRR